MNRAIVFRIVGLAFLAFAALSVYRGEFAVGRGSGAVVTRAHDPDAFWRGVIVQIAAGCVALYLGRSVRRRSASSPSSRLDSRGEPLASPQAAGERPELPNYDPDFCDKA